MNASPSCLITLDCLPSSLVHAVCGEKFIIAPFSIIWNFALNVPGFLVFLAKVPVFLAICSRRSPVSGSILWAGHLKQSLRKSNGVLCRFCFSWFVNSLMGLRVLNFSKLLVFSFRKGSLSDFIFYGLFDIGRCAPIGYFSSSLPNSSSLLSSVIASVFVMVSCWFLARCLPGLTVVHGEFLIVFCWVLTYRVEDGLGYVLVVRWGFILTLLC